MTNLRKVNKVQKAKPTLEGAGVHLFRAFGFTEIPRFDPFLLLDDFHSENPADYMAGFPWHPHRGIVTVTYMINGRVAHGDSMNNKGVIGSGDVQWMTAGSGIIHSEMPEKTEGFMQGFQLWINLPAKDKMVHPRYQGIISDEIPVVNLESGVVVKLIAGSLQGKTGPVHDKETDALYFDVKLPAGITFDHTIPAGHNVFAYIFEGMGSFDENNSTKGETGSLIHWSEGEGVRIQAGPNGLRFLLIAGKPLKEPIAWGGPIVMNTEDELQTAFREYKDGTFIKHKV